MVRGISTRVLNFLSKAQSGFHGSGALALTFSGTAAGESWIEALSCTKESHESCLLSESRKLRE